MCPPMKNGDVKSSDQLTPPKRDLARPDQCCSASSKCVGVRASCQMIKETCSTTVASRRYTYQNRRSKRGTENRIRLRRRTKTVRPRMANAVPRDAVFKDKPRNISVAIESVSTYIPKRRESSRVSDQLRFEEKKLSRTEPNTASKAR